MKSPTSFPASPSHRAFTLVEMLVTISIIGLLATLSVKVAQNSLASARVAEKVANLRSIGLAHGAYIVENGGRCLPANISGQSGDPAIGGNATAWWPYYLLRVAGGDSKILRNPDFRNNAGSRQGIWDDVRNPSTGKIVDEIPGEYCRVEAGFGWNWYTTTTQGSTGDWGSSAAITSASKLIVCLESMSVVGGPNPSIGLNIDAWKFAARTDPNFWAGPRWSKGAITCLFFDGHVAQMKPDEFKEENFKILP